MTPRLFFLPGAGGDPGFWRPVGERLPAGWGKVYFGWPGLGDQPPDPQVNGFDDLVALVERRLDDGGAVDLLAQSMGGAVAMLLALRHPQKIRRIVLTVTSGGLDVAGLGGADWRPTYRRRFPHAAAWISEARPDLGLDLRRIVQPTLLVWGDADPISPLAVGERLAATLPDAHLLVIRGGDHDLAQLRADEVARSVETHLARP